MATWHADSSSSSSSPSPFPLSPSSSSSSSSSPSTSRVSLSRTADDDTVYVAVGKDVEENKLNLIWALENFPARKFCILHVHQPAKMIHLVGAKFLASRLNHHELREFQELERKIMHKILDEYLLLCREVEVHAEKLYIEMDDISRGIVELVYQHDIKKLVMGAAANKHYSEEMMDPMSKKAKYVQQCVPHSCQISYICKGYFIHMWDGDSTPSSTNGFRDSASILHQRTEGGGLELELHEVSQSEEDTDNLDALEGSNIEQLYDQLEQAMMEAEKESRRRGKAEMAVVKAVRRAKALENLYAKELRNRKETEEALAREKEEHKKTKNQWDEERLVTADQRKYHQIQVSDMLRELNEYKKERDELQAERDNSLKLIQDLLRKQADLPSCLQMNLSLCDFSLQEIREATCGFDPLLRIGECGHGSIYKGTVRHTPVVIKMLNPDSVQGPIEFQQEVELLSKLRHPNIAILYGVCSEACALIYEYLPNGSLEDRLNCNDNSSPLPWQARTLIAADLCSVLIFLHSNSPHSFVHGDLKTGNILLDANFACKLSDFGICRAKSLFENSREMLHEIEPSLSFYHLDPEFLTTGEMCPMSDTYSFGIILLQLLTGRSAFSIANEIRGEIDEECVSVYLDSLAGDWPIEQAKQLTRLALSCCNVYPNSRPDLASNVWRELERMRDDCSTSVQFGSQDGEQPPSTSVQFGSEDGEQTEPPSYFICPILQDVMQDPQVAADGYTYEAGAVTAWLERGKTTSPMTNLPLTHLNLVPNLALRSAIYEWQEQH